MHIWKDSELKMRSRDLRQEHLSKALLIKLAWITIASLCLVSIAAMRWDDTARWAYVLGKIGVDLWIFAGFALVGAGNIWLRDEFVALKVSRALLGFTILWLTIATISCFLTKSYLPLIDIAIAVVAIFALLPLTPEQRIRKRQKIIRLARVNGIIWFLAALFLLFAAIVWAYCGARLSCVIAALLSALASLTACFCFGVAENFGGQMQDGTSDEIDTAETLQSVDLVTHPVPLFYVSSRADVLARVAVIYYILALLGTVMSSKDELVGPTVVMVLIGFVSALMTTKIGISPRFDDRLRVSSSTMGTQFIYPTQILLDDRTFNEIEELLQQRESLNYKNARPVRD